MFSSRLSICNERGHAKILQEARLAFEEKRISLMGLIEMVKKELQYWRLLKNWRGKHGLDASSVDIVSTTTLDHDFSALLPPLAGRDWCAEEWSVHLYPTGRREQGGVGHKPGLRRCTHEKDDGVD